MGTQTKEDDDAEEDDTLRGISFRRSPAESVVVASSLVSIGEGNDDDEPSDDKVAGVK